MSTGSFESFYWKANHPEKYKESLEIWAKVSLFIVSSVSDNLLIALISNVTAHSKIRNKCDQKVTRNRRNPEKYGLHGQEMQ